ncbi:hypothetical protein RRG08_055417 [Elysia crispata]|uniref:Uncharacterized protein n=1 Tax=Elysia crispata TaxID=231223 RepID=A0AAE1AQG7_9GAST|nr:hypothetical protein RRG08_055417 [Elysia crispata]
MKVGVAYQSGSQADKRIDYARVSSTKATKPDVLFRHLSRVSQHKSKTLPLEKTRCRVGAASRQQPLIVIILIDKIQKHNSNTLISFSLWRRFR